MAVWLAKLVRCQSIVREALVQFPADQHSGSQNNRREGAAFALTSANG